MDSYIVQPADGETAREVAERVADEFEVEEIRIRGLAEAVRVAGDAAVVPEGATGYFEETVGGDETGRVVESLTSLTRVVFYAESPVFTYFDDGKLYFRGGEALVDALREAGIEPVETRGTPESVVAEMNEDDE